MSAEPPSTFLRSLATRHKKIIRFLIVGVSNTLLGYLLFLGFVWILGRSPERAGTAQFLAYSGGVIWSFYWNRRWTFGGTGKIGGQAVRFFVMQGIMAVLSSTLLGFFAATLPISVHLVWVLATAITTVLNYLSSRFIVFRTTESGG